jgi:hypothetical protein
MELVTMQQNLDNLIWDALNTEGVFKLTEKQKADILAMVGNKCRQNTKERLERKINTPLFCWKRYGIYSRIVLTDKGADYICGQSWSDEMRTLRECILTN